MTESKQMKLDLSTLSLEAILANHSPSQVEKKVKKIQDTSGQSILGLSKSVGLLSSLEKTLVATLNSVWTPYSRTWKVKVTASGRLVFQLRASVRTTKENESGLWLTPSATTISTRSKESMEKRKKYRESIGRKTVTPGNLAEQVQYGKPVTNMWPTPRASAAMGENTKTISKRLETKKSKGKLEESVAMWPTTTSRMYKLPRLPETMKKTKRNPLTNTIEDAVQHREGKSWKETGSLNPTWCEWLMGYPIGHTDLKR